ncbi:hypothetical protein ABGB18_32410 [Nonomuraea sp. B12E4]|uniref:hypothetical protein n=1 Tax=Nonomuraea sp. B12E4 TaxID=3153564 RepID=UPI00325F0F01
MKRILTGVALATTATLVTATPALAAAPKNPAVAVKKKLAPGKGVKFTERTTMINGSRREIVVRRSGTFAFSKSGVAASDITGKLNFSSSDLEKIPEGEFGDLIKAMADPERTIRTGTTSYLSGGLWAAMLPEGKTWFKAPNGPTSGVTGAFGQPLNLAETATLKTLLKGAKPVSDGYAGKTKVGDVWKVSPWLRASLIATPSAKAQKTLFSWRITVDKAGLPTRLLTTFPASVVAAAKGTISVDTRFTGWGASVSIKAPAADDVATEFSDGSDEIPPLNVPLAGLG